LLILDQAALSSFQRPSGGQILDVLLWARPLAKVFEILPCDMSISQQIMQAYDGVKNARGQQIKQNDLSRHSELPRQIS
jgi:hypothetical protein